MRVAWARVRNLSGTELGFDVVVGLAAPVILGFLISAGLNLDWRGVVVIAVATAALITVGFLTFWYRPQATIQCGQEDRDYDDNYKWPDIEGAPEPWNDVPDGAEIRLAKLLVTNIGRIRLDRCRVEVTHVDPPIPAYRRRVPFALRWYAAEKEDRTLYRRSGQDSVVLERLFIAVDDRRFELETFQPGVSNWVTVRLYADQMRKPIERQFHLESRGDVITVTSLPPGPGTGAGQR